MRPEVASLALLGWIAAGLVAAVARRRLVLVARACHEVRGPLTAAFLALDLMHRGGEAPWDRLNALEAQLGRARLAVEDLGAARRGRRAHDRPEPLGVATLLASVGAAWTPVAAAAGRELRVEGVAAGMTVLADRVRLMQAVGNLIANALEHGSGLVTMRARITGDRVRIEVSDEGPGLRQSVAASVRAARTRIGRRGHGLAVAAEIAERAGGVLTAAPSAAGAALVLELPLLGRRPVALGARA